MITIIFAPPRTGKTCFMTHCLRQIAFDSERNRKMAKEIITKNNNGFKLTIPKHCVSSNYNIKFRKFGYSPRHSRAPPPSQISPQVSRIRQYLRKARFSRRGARAPWF